MAFCLSSSNVGGWGATRIPHPRELQLGLGFSRVLKVLNCVPHVRSVGLLMCLNSSLNLDVHITLPAANATYKAMPNH